MEIRFHPSDQMLLAAQMTLQLGHIPYSQRFEDQVVVLELAELPPKKAFFLGVTVGHLFRQLQAESVPAVPGVN